MPKRGLLIFDLDGTLFQAHKVTVPATQRSFQDQGLPAPPADERDDAAERKGEGK